MTPQPRDAEKRLADQAADRFRRGYNCAQSVLWTVAEACGLGCRGCIPGVALGMGGGIAHTGQSCGALTGGVLALGLAVDRLAEGPLGEKKNQANVLGGGLVEAFTQEFGSPDCATILGFSWTDLGASERFKAEQAKDRKCTPCVRWATVEVARLVEALKAGEAP